MDGIAKLLAAAQNRRLVLFVGAGASMAPPTNLPSWRDVNRIVVHSLASAAATAVGEAEAGNAAELVLARHQHEKLPPEYQAQVLAELLRGRYFEVLRYLDSPYPNPTHLAIAWLARLGCVRAIVTTNFDRVLESAFAAVNTPVERHFHPDHFRALAADLGRFEKREAACQLLKIHGSVDDPGTLIDTLAQRKKGFAPPVMNCVQHLLRSGHWLFLGFSGLDLEAEPNYLGLAAEAGTGTGFTWLVRDKTQPAPAVVRLAELYGDRAGFANGNLPDWLLSFTSVISPEPRVWIEKHFQRHATPDAGSHSTALEQNANAWAANLAPPMCAMALALLLSACAQPQAAAKLVEGILRKIDRRENRRSKTGVELLLMKSLASNALGVLLAGLARHEEAVVWITRAVDQAEQAGDPDTRDRFLGNLAVSLEALGRIDEATRAYQSAIAGYRERDDQGVLAFGLASLSAHLIRQMRLDEAHALAVEAVSWAKRAGDERQRGTALSHLGMIAKLREDFPAALKMLEEVEELFTRLGNDDAAAAAAGNRGEVLAAMGHLDEAEQVQLAVLQVEERLGRRDNQGATCLSLGLVNQQRGDAAAAEDWFVKAVAIYSEIKDPSNQGFALYRLTSLMTGEGRFEEALELAQIALPLVSERNPATTADLWAQVGQANLNLGYVRRAEEAYRKAIVGFEQHKGFEQLQVAKAQAAATMNLGTALLLQENNSEAAAAFARAGEIWQGLNSLENVEYCRLGEAAARLDDKLATLSDAAHALPDRETQRAAAREMVTLYPGLIAMYEKVGARQLAATSCDSAASTARFAGDVEHAVDWYRQAAGFFHEIGLPSQARDALTSAEDLLRQWSNALMRQQEMAAAVPVLLQAAEVCEQLGWVGKCATATLNAAIGLLQTSQQFAEARQLAEHAAALFIAGSDDLAMAQKVIAFCDSKLPQR